MVEGEGQAALAEGVLNQFRILERIFQQQNANILFGRLG
jgi:hypothetical protein